MRGKGLAADEARRQALAAFGGVEKHKEELRDGRGLAWLGGLSLDLKLGFRMLLKYPGLTLAGGLAIAIAIGIGAGWYDLTGKIMSPRIPLPEGDRIVVIETQDARTNAPEPRVLHDFQEWQRELRTIEDLGAYRTDTRNLIVGSAAPEPIQIAELTAAAFATARVPPLLGRGLVHSDELPGAPSVVVLGYDVWQRSLQGRAGRPRTGRAAWQHAGDRRSASCRKASATRSTTMPGHRCRCALRTRRSRARRSASSGGSHPDLARAGECGVARVRPADGRSVPGHARASPAGRDAARGSHGLSRRCGARRTESARAAGVDDCLHERRHPGVREDGDTGGRDRDSCGARCGPRAHHRSALRGGARARVRVGGDWPAGCRPGVEVGNRKRQPRQRRRTVLDGSWPGSLDGPVCRWSRGRQRGDAVSASRRCGSRARVCSLISPTWAPAAPRCDSVACGRAR